MKKGAARRYIVTIAITLIALALMCAYNFITFYSNAVSNVKAIGESLLAQESEKLSGYLTKGLDVLQVTTITMEYMLAHNASPEEMQKFLVEESERYMEEIDPNFTGIYGWIGGNYLDGSEWVPDEDYVPQEREWYQAALAAGGAPTLVSPYLDAKTNTIMISVSQLLYDGESVISLDIVMDEIQVITQNIHLNDMGYGFVVDGKGLVIAHYDEAEKGKNYLEQNTNEELIQKIYQTKDGNFSAKINGENCRVFVKEVKSDWIVVLIVSDTRLFHDLRMVFVRNILVCGIVFIAILIFCTLSFQQLRMHMKLEEESRREVERLNTSIVSALARTIDAKDRYTKGHSQRVADYALEIAKRMGKSKEEQKLVYQAGLLHDLGKIRVPEEVINKPGKLTEEEFEFIKMHPVTGYYILKGVYENPMIVQGAKFHHERYDGKGYPNGFAGKFIPEIARIIGVADAYDAMTSNRSYRDALPQAVVRGEIAKGAGVQFDPVIADIMLQMIQEDTAYHMRQMGDRKKVVLVVDDEPESIEMTKYIMADEPMYHILGVSSGQKALQTLGAEKIDLILLDVQISGMDGFEILRKVREMSSVPVVFMMDAWDMQIIRRAQEAGVDDYVMKPFLPLAFLEVIHGILDI